MTPTQIARRSDALYADGTCGMTRRMLCDMVAQRESDLEDVMAENDRLWKRVRKLETANLDVTARLTDYIGQYDPTDAFVAEGFDCYGCVHENCCDGMQYTDRCKLLDRARELGVEVDG